MSWLQATFLGIVQGLTEFFPVSSSAHLKLARLLLGVDATASTVIFDLCCHLGTLIALLFFLKKDILSFYTKPKTLVQLTVATLPLIPCYFLLKPLRELLNQPQYLGLCLMATSAILFLSYAYRLRREECSSFKRQISDAFWIGTWQSAALIPGISRSASTISAARVLGWNNALAVRFSFLLSIPAIIGGNCLEAFKIITSSAGPHLAWPLCLWGGVCSCAVGLGVVRYALLLLEKGNLKPFAWYCLLIGVVAFYQLGPFSSTRRSESSSLNFSSKLGDM